VIIFKKSADEFKASARERRLTLREHTHDAEALKAEERKKAAEGAEYARLKEMLSNWCHINYAEAFKMVMHLKAVRLFCESVLRYGLTASYQDMRPNFKAFLLMPKKGKGDALRKTLSGLYGGSAAAMMEGGDEETAVPGATGEFYPYVYATIETEPNIV